jgi:LETM1 and EF-hand domain-containing protein 1
VPLGSLTAATNPISDLVTITLQLNEAELDVSGEKASYKEKLEVLQQQQELIEDEAEQEQEETEAREQAKREKKEKEERERLSRLEEEARLAKDMLPGDEVGHEVQRSAAG